MNNNIVLFGKIATKSFLGWIKIMAGGGIVSILGLITGIVLWSNNTGAGFAGARAGIAGALLGVLFLFVQEFWTALLFWGSLAALFYYTTLASKYGIQKAIYLTWEYKLGDIFTSRMEQYLDRIFGKKQQEKYVVPQDVTQVKKAIAKEVKQDPANSSLQKRIFQYLLKRIRLNDINFTDPELNIQATIVRKIRELISDRIEPSMQPFWIVCGIQVIVLVLAIVYDHH